MPSHIAQQLRGRGDTSAAPSPIHCRLKLGLAHPCLACRIFKRQHTVTHKADKHLQRAFLTSLCLALSITVDKSPIPKTCTPHARPQNHPFIATAK